VFVGGVGAVDWLHCVLSVGLLGKGRGHGGERGGLGDWGIGDWDLGNGEGRGGEGRGYGGKGNRGETYAWARRRLPMIVRVRERSVIF